MKNLTVVVWMVTYNHEDFLEQAIESVMMQQTDFSYKLFIGEDFSLDSTRTICENLKSKYPDKIELFLHEKNIGSTANGIYMYEQCFKSNAKYIALCEGDDYWTDSLKLQKQVDFLEANTEYVLCYHPVNILKKDGTIVNDFITSLPKDYENIETLARLGNYIHTPTVVFRNVINEFPFEFKSTPIGDSYIYMLLAEHGKLGYLEDKMAIYRYGIGIFSGKSNLDNIKNELIMLGCLMSSSKNKAVNKILLNRYILLVDDFQKLIESQYNNVDKDSFFARTIKFIKRNYKQPKKILSRIYHKIFK